MDRLNLTQFFFNDCRVGIEVPKIEVRFENLNIEADVQAGTRALPTLVNVSRDFVEVCLFFFFLTVPHNRF